MLRRFDLHRASTVAEAVALRQRFGDDAVLYAGGTELLLALKMGVLRWPNLIDVKPIAELGELRVIGSTLRIGATVTHWRLERDPLIHAHLPAFARLERTVANVRVRASGTLAGNLAFGEPHADPPAMLLALGATIVLQGGAGTRALPIEEFLTGMYQTALGADEVIVAIDVPIPAPDVRISYLKCQILERPTVGVAVAASIRNGVYAAPPAVVVGAVDEVPRRVPTAQFAGAKAGDAGVAAAIAEAAQGAVETVGDLAGSEEYKRHLVGVYVRRALGALVEAS